jgi:chloride channel protein, CIC family
VILQSLPGYLGKLPKQARTVLVTCAYGLVAGGATVAFQLLITLLYNNTFKRLAEQSTATFMEGSFAIIMSTALIVGLLMRYAPEAAGSGIPQLKLGYWKEFGFVSFRAVWVKFVGGILSLGGGSSLGREGPSVHFAGGIASNVAGIFGEPKQRRRHASAAGAAAGLAAAFNTPLAAITFVLEEIIEDLNSRALGSVLLASVIGAFVVHGIIGRQPAFTLEEIGAASWQAYVLVPIVAALGSFVGMVFQKSSLRLRGNWKRQRGVPMWMGPAIGGLITWAIGCAVFVETGHLGVFSLGYDDLSLGLANHLTWKLAAVLLICKLVATIACYGFGGCGGIFSPTLFFGGMCGVVVAGVWSMFMPLHGTEVTLLAVVGMSACLGGVVRAQVTGILIVFEMTHEFSVVPALMLGALVSEAVALTMARHNFYEALLLQDGHNLEHVIPPRDLQAWQQLPVSAIANFKPVVIEHGDMANAQTVLAPHPYSRFPVVENGEPVGVLTLAEMRAAADAKRPPRMERAVVCLRNKTVRDLQNLLINSTTHVVLIVDERDRLLGIVTLHDLLRAEVSVAENQE